MNIKAIKTDIFKENNDLADFILTNVGANLQKKTVLVITSKLLSLSEGLAVNKTDHIKEELIKSECDHYLGLGLFGHHITIKNNLIMPTAGIDNSNSEHDKYLLLPKDIATKTKRLHEKISESLGFREWGIIISDSKTTLLRRGVTGVSLSYFGFKGLEELQGKKDLFGRELRVTTLNRVDALAAVAVFEMGESNEQKPLTIITDVDLTFTTEYNINDDLYLNVENDIYSPLYKDKIQN